MTQLDNWRQQEKDTAARYAGRVTPGSGNGWVAKNDIRTETESIECKTTAAASYTLKYMDLWKAYKTALMDGRRMVFEIQFEKRGRFVILAEDDYMELRDKHAGA